MELKKHKEERAYLIFLFAMCEQNDYYIVEQIGSYYWLLVEYLEVENKNYRCNFSMLIKEYANTECYAKALEEYRYMGTLEKS